jgi:hypothetical protein
MRRFIIAVTRFHFILSTLNWDKNSSNVSDGIESEIDRLLGLRPIAVVSGMINCT